MSNDFRTVPTSTLLRVAEQLSEMIEAAGDYATRDAIEALREIRAFISTRPLSQEG